MAQGGRHVAIVLLSKTGGGKSSLANAILDTTQFEVGRGMLSSTVHCKCISTHARGRDLTVVDTPGTMEVGDEERAKAEIMRAITFCPDGFDIFLVVIKCDSRFTAEERLAIDVAANMFGDNFYNHAIVVFSHGDDYDNDEAKFKQDLDTIRRQIPYLNQLLNKCGNRFLLMDNGRRCDKMVQNNQIQALFSVIDSLTTRNGNRKYTNEHFESEKRKRDEAERKKQAEAEEENRRRETEMMQLARVQVESEMHQRESRRMEEASEMRKQEMQQQMLVNLAGGIMQFGMMAMSALADQRSHRENGSTLIIQISEGDEDSDDSD